MARLLESKGVSPPPSDPKARAEALRLADRLEGWRRQRWPKALRACGRPPLGLSCDLKICPACRARSQKEAFLRYRPLAVAALGAVGEASFITLTVPEFGELDARIIGLLSAIRAVPNRQAWKKAEGLKTRVGIAWAFDMTPGSRGQGHPHLHLMVFARDLQALAETEDLLLKFWTDRFPGFMVRPDTVEHLGRTPDCWAPRLSYLLKGVPLMTDWPDEVFDAAVLELTSGHHHRAALGLMGPARPGGPRMLIDAKVPKGPASKVEPQQTASSAVKNRTL